MSTFMWHPLTEFFYCFRSHGLRQLRTPIWSDIALFINSIWFLIFLSKHTTLLLPSYMQLALAIGWLHYEVIVEFRRFLQLFCPLSSAYELWKTRSPVKAQRWTTSIKSIIICCLGNWRSQVQTLNLSHEVSDSSGRMCLPWRSYT